MLSDIGDYYNKKRIDTAVHPSTGLPFGTVHPELVEGMNGAEGLRANGGVLKSFHIPIHAEPVEAYDDISLDTGPEMDDIKLSLAMNSLSYLFTSSECRSYEVKFRLQS